MVSKRAYQSLMLERELTGFLQKLIWL